jgi:hypothetical protein
MSWRECLVFDFALVKGYGPASDIQLISKPPLDPLFLLIDLGQLQVVIEVQGYSEPTKDAH